jgi:hypothetical protein
MWHGTLWELLLLLALYALMSIIFVGLPVGLVVYIIYKVIQHRRDVSESSKLN